MAILGSSGIYCRVGSGSGTISMTVYGANSWSNSSTSLKGYTGYTVGTGSDYPYDISASATPSSGYSFSHWVVYVNDEENATGSYIYSTTNYSNPCTDYTSNWPGQDASIIFVAHFTSSGSSGGGDDDTYYYYAYDTYGTRLQGPKTTSSSSISRPSLSGYSYLGYIYHSSLSKCLNAYPSLDGTGTRCTSHNSSYPYVVFFYEEDTPDPEFYYRAYDMDGNVLAGTYTSYSSTIYVPSVSSNYTYLGYVYYSSWSSCLNQGLNRNFDGTTTYCS